MSRTETSFTSKREQRKSNMDIRTGFGYDIHRLLPAEGKRPLLLAGVRIDGQYAIDAHSDGDIVLHALSNAILSGLGLADIGYYFPDSKEATRDMSSERILSFALSQMQEMGYQLSNVVVDIVLEEPKIKPYRDEIRQSLARLLTLDVSRIGLSANTGEKIGVVGRSEGIVVYSIVLLFQE